MSLLLSCTKSSINPYENIAEKVTALSMSDQHVGDIDVGKNYLLYGDFADRGIPKEVFNNTLGVFLSKLNLLDRQGVNANIQFAYTATFAENGVEIVAPNCFQCHAGYVDGQFVVGLGNTFADFTLDQSVPTFLLDNGVQTIYRTNSPEWVAYLPFSKALKAVGKHLVIETIGVNPVDKLALVLAAHWELHDLSWKESPSFPIPTEVFAIDVPPL